MLTRYLSNSLFQEVTIHEIHKNCDQGRSSVAYSFHITYNEKGHKQSKQLFLKVYNNKTIESGRKEFNILKKLKQLGLPVPTAYCFEENNEILGRPFIIIEKIIGKNASVFFDDKKNAENIVKKMAKCLVAVHKVDPNSIENSNTLQEQYNIKQHRILKTRQFINEKCMNFLGFCPPYQRRLIAALKKLEIAAPLKTEPSLLHLDYEPNHIIVNDNKKCIITDWGEANIGDPAYDVAWTYHKLKLESHTTKIDLSDWFVEQYKKQGGRNLVNLKIFKDNVAIEMARWCGIPIFCENDFKNYVKLSSLLFGDIIGEFKRRQYVHKKAQIMKSHHTPIWTNIKYIQNYAFQYLEEKYKKN